MMDKVFKGLRSVLYGFSVTAMLLMLVIIFSQVVTRYFFGWTPNGPRNWPGSCFVWVVFLGSALIMGESGHLAVQFVPNHFKGTAVGNVLEIIINLSGYVFILILLFQGTRMTRVMTFQMAPGLDISMSWVYFVIPLSSVLMLLYLVKDTVRIIKGFSGPKE